MRKILIILFPVFILISVNINYSQNYVEQNSGVTTALTSVSVNQTQYSYYGNAWICGNNGVVLKTINSGGANWINVSGNGIPSNVDLVNIFCVDTITAITAGYTSSGTFVYRTSNGGMNWQQVFTQPNGFINAVWMKTLMTGFMYGDPIGGRWSLWKTSNGGVNWDSSGLYLPQTGAEAGWNNSLFVRNNNIWFGTNNHRIYFSSNFGTNWSVGAVAETNVYAIWFSFDDSLSLYGYYGGSNAYKTTNGGASWTLMNCPGTGNFAGFVSGTALSPNNPFPPFLSWTARSDNKIYQSFIMSDWNTNYTAPAGNYLHIGTNYNKYIQFTWAVRSNGGITRIITIYGDVRKISSMVPNDFSLSQNYPNPFNPNTKIKFDTPPPPSPKGREQWVRLIIYDILGREIAVLVNEGLKPGTYEIEWDASNYPSGVYFYKLVTDDFTETKKMVFIKCNSVRLK